MTDALCSQRRLSALQIYHEHLQGCAFMAESPYGRACQRVWRPRITLDVPERGGAMPFGHKLDGICLSCHQLALHGKNTVGGVAGMAGKACHNSGSAGVLGEQPCVCRTLHL